MAKLIIKLINDVAQVVNADPLVGDRLKIVFLPNYNVSLAEVIIPAADLSEQISTAGMEASGTGNMKLAVNGALTVGTLDGANIEIRERVGDDNIFIFGLTAEEVMAKRANGYQPRAEIEAQPALRGALQEIAAGRFAQVGWQQVQPLLDNLWHHDHFMVAADFAAYAAIQRQIDQRLCRPCRVDPAQRAEYRAGRLVLVRSRDPRLRPRHLAGRDRLSGPQVITVGASRPVRCLIPAIASATAIRERSAVCASCPCFFGSGSKASR